MDSGWGTTGGGPSRSPFWRTPKESWKGLGSVTFKINTQHTRSSVTVNLSKNIGCLRSIFALSIAELRHPPSPEGSMAKLDGLMITRP
jgi:hypothetical protein